MSRQTAQSRLRLATYILAGVFALSTALLAGLLAGEQPPSLVGPTVTPGVPPEDWVPYTVRPGDKLGELAQSRGVPLSSVLEANGLERPSVSPGEVVYLPSLSTATPTPTPKPVIFDAGTLTAAGAFVTAVGSLVGVVLTYMRSRREMELADQRHKRELEFEKEKLELERLRLQDEGPGDEDGDVRPSVE